MVEFIITTRLLIDQIIYLFFFQLLPLRELRACVAFSKDTTAKSCQLLVLLHKKLK